MSRAPGSRPSVARLGISPAVLARVLAFIDAEMARPLRVIDLAGVARLSPFHFARMFRHSVGRAPHAYITARRMAAARELLLATELPIVEVSRRVGFRTQAHFTGVFRVQTGVTPGRFRDHHRAAGAEPARPVPQPDLVQP